MPHIKIELEHRNQIVLFNYLYSLYQHLGWPRASKYKKTEINTKIYEIDYITLGKHNNNLGKKINQIKLNSK